MAIAARRSSAGGLLCAYGYTAGVQPQRRLFTLLMWAARVYLWRRLLSGLPGGKRLRVYSINAMRRDIPSGSARIWSDSSAF